MRAEIPGTASAYLVVLLFLKVAVTLWLFPMVVAHTLVPRTHHPGQLSPPASDTARVAGALLGLWSLIESTPSMVLFLFNTFAFADFVLRAGRADRLSPLPRDPEGE